MHETKRHSCLSNITTDQSPKGYWAYFKLTQSTTSHCSCYEAITKLRCAASTVHAALALMHLSPSAKPCQRESRNNMGACLIDSCGCTLFRCSQMIFPPFKVSISMNHHTNRARDTAVGCSSAFLSQAMHAGSRSLVEIIVLKSCRSCNGELACQAGSTCSQSGTFDLK